VVPEDVPSFEALGHPNKPGAAERIQATLGSVSSRM
jgi:hypothetical protein